MGIIETLNQWDTELFLYLNSFHNSFWDYTMTLFTRTEIWLLFYLVIFITIIRKYKRKSLLVFLVITLLIVLADQGSGILKHSIERLRPSHDPYVAPLAHNFFKKGGLYGFVSAHAANSFGFAIFSVLLFRNRIFTVFMITWSLLIASTRIYLGVHYPGDILGGIILGSLIGWGMYRLLLFLEAFMRPRKPEFIIPMENKRVYNIILAAFVVIGFSMLVVNFFLKHHMFA